MDLPIILKVADLRISKFEEFNQLLHRDASKLRSLCRKLLSDFTNDKDIKGAFTQAPEGFRKTVIKPIAIMVAKESHIWPIKSPSVLAGR